MNDLQNWMLAWPAFVAGLLMAGLFFAGLWWTVRVGLRSERPAVWFLLSWFGRMAMVMLVFWWVGGHDAHRWLSAAAGFLLVQMALRLWQRRLVSGAR